ncbi:MAG: VOC family protein [Planctomycetota bacterium]|nr:MAG: VOC family protein [Planctomycetota bacterium]
MSAALDPVDHVAVEVADIGRAVDWYTRSFRCRVLYQDATWAFLEFANLKMALVLPGQHPAHLSLVRADAAAFGPLRTHRDGTRYVYLQDPDGNTVEVMPPG